MVENTQNLEEQNKILNKIDTSWSDSSCAEGKLTETGVFCEKLGELVTLVLVVATVAAVAVGGDADFGRAQVVWSHHSACSR